jgi:hypothetical protein
MTVYTDTFWIVDALTNKREHYIVAIAFSYEEAFNFVCEVIGDEKINSVLVAFRITECGGLLYKDELSLPTHAPSTSTN